MLLMQLDLIPAFYLAIPFLFFLIFVNWLGYRFKNRHIRKFPGTEHVGIGPTEGSLLGLTALLLSFTFSMSSTKFENRRQLIITEANHIGVAILRCDLLPDSIRHALRADLKNYLEARIAYYDAKDNEETIEKMIAQSDSISRQIWRQVSDFSNDQNRRNEQNNRLAIELMVLAVNDMIDIASTREASRHARVPGMIFIVLCMLIIVSAFLSGYGSKSLERNKVLVTAFALITTLALYLIVDLDKPRQGFVNLNSTEQFMVDLRKLFTENK